MDEKIYKLFIGQKNFMLGNTSLDCLNQFMMTDDFVLPKLESAKLEPAKLEPAKPEPKLEPAKLEPAKLEPAKLEPAKQTFHFYPKSKDSVFTCVYVAIYGEQALSQKGVNITNLLMNEKRLISEHCNSNPAVLKTANYKVTIAKMNEIKCELMTQPFMNKIGGLVACSIYYKRPIYAVFEEIGAYLRFASKEYVDNDEEDDNDSDDIILRINSSRIFLDQSGKSADIRAKYLALPHYEKPMLGASNYKLDELTAMYSRIFGPNETKMSKPEYYEKILVKMSACISAKLF